MESFCEFVLRWPATCILQKGNSKEKTDRYFAGSQSERPLFHDLSLYSYSAQSQGTCGDHHHSRF